MDQDGQTDSPAGSVPSKADNVAFADAIECGDTQAVGLLVQRYPALVNHPDWVPPPLHCAVLWNQPKVAELLLDNGADIEMLDPDRQTTPLRYAIMYCKVDLIPLLIARNANAGSIVENGTSAFQLAVEAANGAFEEFEDLPRRSDYERVVEVLKELTVE
jgi:ankyrin repeat protein